MRRPLTFVAVLSVIAAALSVSSAADGRSSPEPGASARAAVDKPLWQQAQNYYTTLRAPRRCRRTSRRSEVDGDRPEPTWWQEAQRKHSTGFPPAARGAGPP